MCMYASGAGGMGIMGTMGMPALHIGCPVILVNNLDPERSMPEPLFNLFRFFILRMRSVFRVV